MIQSIDMYILKSIRTLAIDFFFWIDILSDIYIMIIIIDVYNQINNWDYKFILNYMKNLSRQIILINIREIYLSIRISQKKNTTNWLHLIMLNWGRIWIHEDLSRCSHNLPKVEWSQYKYFSIKFRSLLCIKLGMGEIYSYFKEWAPWDTK